MKTNHRRGFVAPKFSLGQRTSFYCTGAFKQFSIDGTSTSANSTVTSGNSKSVRRDRAGAKKFVHSRRRRKDRDFLNQQDFKND